MENENLNPNQFVPNKTIRKIAQRYIPNRSEEYRPPKIAMFGVQKLANLMGHMGIHPLLPENVERRQQAIQQQHDMYLDFLKRMKESNGDNTNFGEKSFEEINGENNGENNNG